MEDYFMKGGVDKEVGTSLQRLAENHKRQARICNDKTSSNQLDITDAIKKNMELKKLKLEKLKTEENERRKAFKGLN